MRFLPAFLVMFALPIACSFHGRPTNLTLKADGFNLPRATPRFGRAYDAYLVNISGPGISPTVSSSSIGFYAPDCVELGISSLLVSAETLSKTGVRLTLPAGTGRKIQVLGVATDFGSEVVGKDVTALFQNGKRPELYRLALAEDQTILLDRKVDLTPSTVASTVDILDKCFAKDTGPITAESISAIRVLVSSADTLTAASNSIQNVALDKDSGALSLIADNTFSPNTQINFGTTTPEGRTGIVWTQSSGAHFLLKLVLGGNFTATQGPDSTCFIGAADAAYAKSGEYVISRAANAVRYLFYNEGNLACNANSTLLLNSDEFFVFPSADRYRYFKFYTEGVGFASATDLLPVNIEMPAEVNPVPTAASQSSAGTDSRSLASSKGIYVMYAAAGGTFTKFFAHENNTLVPYGNDLTIHSNPLVATLKTAVTPTSSFLFIKYTTTGDTLKVVRLDEHGGIGSVVASLPFIGIKDLAVDPLGRFLIVLHTPAGTPTISTYQITDTGIDTTAVSNVNSGLALQANVLTVLYTR